MSYIKEKKPEQYLTDIICHAWSNKSEISLSFLPFISVVNTINIIESFNSFKSLILLEGEFFLF